MSRRARGSTDAGLHYVWNVSALPDGVFRDYGDARVCALLLEMRSRDDAVDLLAWRFRAARYDLVLRPVGATDLGAFMRRVLSAWSGHHRKRDGQSRRLWTDRYHSVAVQPGPALPALVTELTGDPRDSGRCRWPWVGPSDRAVEPPPATGDPSADAHSQDRLRQLVRHSLRNRLPVGEPGWIEEELARRGRLRPPGRRGRPRKAPTEATPD